MILPILITLLTINLITFVLFGIDKHKARNNQWRIPEKRLFAIIFLGGSFGGWMGMKIFRHKTQHRSFRWGIPLIGLTQISLMGYLLFFK